MCCSPQHCDVYNGGLLWNTKWGKPFLDKVFDLDMKCLDKSFEGVTEYEVLSRIQHRNLVPILTTCSTIDNKDIAFKALVYKFMPKRNLDTWLHNTYSGSSSKCLSLAPRASIATGIADTVAYLHNDCERKIIHCDLKPTNILLDDDKNAYLGGFGIASLIGHSSLVTSTRLKVTIGYIALGTFPHVYLLWTSIIFEDNLARHNW
ncbi:probable LRR receptor-like serine/threonine-protein kinase At3g47570 [Triticum urartu]|nr:probable LRR receptor-like serine/threonine-protein kinase At3g47570 [Triticum urartu]